MNQTHRTSARRVLPIAFLLFIGWVIYLAHTGQKGVFPLNLAGFAHSDKLAHFILYGLITAALGSLLHFQKLSIRGRSFDLGAVFSTVFAGVEELSQLASPHRSPDLIDLGCGLLGIALARLLLKKAEIS